MKLVNPSVQPPQPTGLSISNLVNAVRNELENIEKEMVRRNREPLFQLSKMEIEVQFVVTAGESLDSGFDIKIVSVGGKTEATAENTQKVLLTYDVLPEMLGTAGTRAHPTTVSKPEKDTEPLP